MATLRAGHTATLLAYGQVLMAGGNTMVNGFYVSVSSAELYNPLANTWSPAGNMAAARYDQTATLLTSGLMLVTGGHDAAGAAGGYRSSAELYNPASNTWGST